MALRAPKRPINAPVVFYGTLAELRRKNGQDPDLQYVSAYTCPADGKLNSSEDGYIGLDGRVYCSVDCAYMTEVIEEPA